MADDMTGVSDAFKAFLTEAPQHAQAWMAAVQALDGASALDEKTGALTPNDPPFATVKPGSGPRIKLNRY